MSEMSESAEAKRRAEWLHKHNAHKDWVILSVSETAFIKDELLVLERERNEARGYALKLKRERDEAREENTKLLDIAERAINDLAWFNETNAQRLRVELNQLKEDAK